MLQYVLIYDHRETRGHERRDWMDEKTVEVVKHVAETVIAVLSIWL